jgi:hypothetical protein
MAIHTEHHAPALPKPEELKAPWVVGKMMRTAGIIGGIAAVAALIIFVTQSGTPLGITKFMRAYLVGFMFCAGLTLGNLALLSLQHITGGKWGLVMRRIFEAGSRNLLPLAIMFIPIVLGLKYLFPWAVPNNTGLTAHGEHALHVRHAYLNPSMFTLRAIIYFAGWFFFMWLLNKWSLRQEQPFDTPEEANQWRLKFMRLGSASVLFYAISISLAAVDWVMSLDAVWYSTIWGMLYMAGQALCAMAFAIIVLVTMAKYEPMKSLLRKTELHDNGKLLLAFVMLFTYLSFSQFIIIWSGNLKEEIPWYAARVRNGWMPVLVILFLFHFVVPFLLLLNRNLKKHGPRLLAVALLLVGMRALDLYWHIMPTFADLSWPTGHFPGVAEIGMDLVIIVAMAAIWMTLFFWQLGKRPILPAYHPLVPEILEKHHGAH